MKARNGEHARFFQLMEEMGPVYGGCIIWPFGETSGGYGAVDRPHRLAHRAALVLSGSPRPEPPGDHALHSCDNPPCVNVRHLRWGTNRENVNDMLARGRQQRLRGEARGTAKLTWDQVREIRNAFTSGSSKSELARQHGVAQPTIMKIVNHITWKEEI